MEVQAACGLPDLDAEQVGAAWRAAGLAAAPLAGAAQAATRLLLLQQGARLVLSMRCAGLVPPCLQSALCGARLPKGLQDHLRLPRWVH